MHTATQLDLRHFAITVDGRPAPVGALLPDWTPRDRFGLVVDRPLGGVGASLLLQLAIAQFYATDASRPGHAYPEVYVFHVGGLQASMAWYDVFPPRKEVVVPDEPAAILDAINDRGITRLAVVDGAVEAVRHHHQEPASALDRIVSAFAYAPEGRVDGADVTITARDGQLCQNTEIVLHPESTVALQQHLFSILPDVREDEDAVLPTVPDVDPEVRAEIARGRAAISTGGLPVESYRRVPVAEALGMLHARAPVAVVS